MVSYQGLGAYHYPAEMGVRQPSDPSCPCMTRSHLDRLNLDDSVVGRTGRGKVEPDDVDRVEGKGYGMSKYKMYRA